MSDTTERLSDRRHHRVGDRLTDEQVQAIIDWPVPLGRMSAPALAREVQDFRRLAALCAEHGGIERVVAMGLAVAGMADDNEPDTVDAYAEGLRALHEAENDPDQDGAYFCRACDHPYPCPTIRMIDEAGL